MPIDTHVRLAAWFHVALGALRVCLLCFVGLLFGVFGALAGASAHGSDVRILAWLAGFGVALFLAALMLFIVEIIGGAMLLRGSTAGRAITIVCSVLELPMVPFGTAVGIYSLWALLREAPRPGPVLGQVVIQPGAPQRD